MSFFTDALGDTMFCAGTITVTVKSIYYDNGFAKNTSREKKFIAKKSVQPLSPDEAQLQGFPDYGPNEFITIFSLKEIPMPSNKQEAVVVKFNGKSWYVRKVLPFVWDKDTPMEMGYYETILSRYNENQLNPDGGKYK
ncbi:MAG: hypothetical protein II453_17370 [Alphaproteobacteria bacterium]|nr:hypothetical protein [Alphaproteobacteria bacterium]